LPVPRPVVPELALRLRRAVLLHRRAGVVLAPPPLDEEIPRRVLRVPLQLLHPGLHHRPPARILLPGLPPEHPAHHGRLALQPARAPQARPRHADHHGPAHAQRDHVHAAPQALARFRAGEPQELVQGHLLGVHGEAAAGGGLAHRDLAVEAVGQHGAVLAGEDDADVDVAVRAGGGAAGDGGGGRGRGGRGGEAAPPAGGVRVVVVAAAGEGGVGVGRGVAVGGGRGGGAALGRHRGRDRRAGPGLAGRAARGFPTFLSTGLRLLLLLMVAVVVARAVMVVALRGHEVQSAARCAPPAWRRRPARARTWGSRARPRGARTSPPAPTAPADTADSRRPSR
ncbi:hypothetical protein DFJ74DRAFT_738351, partial [Hyaloraphidium curvatum]